MVIIIGAVFVILVVIFFITTAMKEEDFMMSKLRNVYLYLVSFVALMMILAGLIFTVQNITDVIFPTHYNYETMPIEKGIALSEEDKRIYAEKERINQENRQTDSKKNVAKSVAVVLVAFPTFIYHWRKIEKEKNEPTKI